MAKSDATYWFSFESSAHTQWHVVATTPEAFPWLEGAEGVCLSQKQVVAIDRSAPQDRAECVLVHEMLHAELSGPGDGTTLANVLGLTTENIADVEENLVSYLAPKIYQLFSANGFLKLPRLPKRETKTRHGTANPRRPLSGGRSKGLGTHAKGRPRATAGACRMPR
jgi:hypothetical protein